MSSTSMALSGRQLWPLRWLLASNACNSVYNQLAFCGPIFLLFLAELNIDAAGIGVLLSIFPFCMLLAMVAGPWAARLGAKRVLVGFCLARTAVLLLLIAAPALVGVVGKRGTLVFVALVLVAFALLRAVSVTAWGIWSHQVVPPGVRGRYTAMDSMLSAVAGAAAMALGGAFLGQDPDTRRFVGLFLIAAVFGVASPLFAVPVGGGGPAHTTASTGVWAAMQDRAFLRFLSWSALLSIGWTAAATFAPLYLLEVLHLPAGRIVLLESILLWSGLTSTWAWGVMADRGPIGRILLLTTAGVTIYPVGLLLLPATTWTFPMALLLVVVVGTVLPGWGIAQLRFLYVRAVSPRGSGGYLGLSTAVGGCVQGVTMIGTGVLIEISRQWPMVMLPGGLPLPRFWPVLLLSVASLSAGALLLAGGTRTRACWESVAT